MPGVRQCHHAPLHTTLIVLYRDVAFKSSHSTKKRGAFFRCFFMPCLGFRHRPPRGVIYRGGKCHRSRILAPRRENVFSDYRRKYSFPAMHTHACGRWRTPRISRRISRQKRFMKPRSVAFLHRRLMGTSRRKIAIFRHLPGFGLMTGFSRK